MATKHKQTLRNSLQNSGHSPQASPRGDCWAQFCQSQQTMQIKEIWYNHQITTFCGKG